MHHPHHQWLRQLLHQSEYDRYVAHLLYASPIKRGDAEVIEDLLPVYDTKVKLRIPESVKKVRLLPSDKEMEIKRNGAIIEVIVPKFTCHSALVFEY